MDAHARLSDILAAFGHDLTGDGGLDGDRQAVRAAIEVLADEIIAGLRAHGFEAPASPAGSSTW